MAFQTQPRKPIEVPSAKPSRSTLLLPTCTEYIGPHTVLYAPFQTAG